jgi:oxygen-independent coproporphyrinogen-3 oxidase
MIFLMVHQLSLPMVYEDFKENDYRRLIGESNSGSPENIAIYIHIPFCRKICFYCGCNACSLGEGKKVIPYLESLKKEIALVKSHSTKAPGFPDPLWRYSQCH